MLFLVTLVSRARDTCYKRLAGLPVVEGTYELVRAGSIAKLERCSELSAPQVAWAVNIAEMILHSCIAEAVQGLVGRERERNKRMVAGLVGEMLLMRLDMGSAIGNIRLSMAVAGYSWKLVADTPARIANADERLVLTVTDRKA